MSARSTKLSRHFGLIEQGKKKVEKMADARLFLEAVCDQPDQLRCVERLVSSSAALGSLQNSIRFDVSVKFLNGPATDFLAYLRAPGLDQLGNGLFLRKIVLSIVDPPTFWNALVEAHSRKVLIEASEVAFAWLLLQLLMLPSCTVEADRVAQNAVNDRSLLDSPSLEIRSFGYKIQNILNTKSTSIPYLDDHKPGGRHDNDFEDFRKISILPTPDEIASTETPFYRKADEIYEIEPEHRPAMHHDNQFRLLREDLLAELRNDLQIARGQKKGRRSAALIDGLIFNGIDCGTEIRRKPCSLTFMCSQGLPQISQIRKSERKAFITQNRNILKHQSFGCLTNGREIVAFASLDRNETLLAEDIPVLVLQVAESDSLKRVLTRAKYQQPFQFVVVDTPVFAYEHILRQLQEKYEFPLSECLLSSKPSLQALTIDAKLSHVMEQISASQGQNLHLFLGTSRKISLDQSQFESLKTALLHSLSIIQGPPGNFQSLRQQRKRLTSVQEQGNHLLGPSWPKSCMIIQRRPS